MSIVSTTVSGLLKEIEQLFSGAGIPTPRLDAEVLLAHALGVTRPYLHAHPDYAAQGTSLRKFEELVKRRLKREPVAYITGTKEFYGQEFIVTPDVLIPRPETEALAELLLASEPPLSSKPLRPRSSEARQGKQLAPSGVERKDGGEQAKTTKLLDVGCGSGCIGVTLKLERPEWDVTLCDISSAALNVAKNNSEKLGAKVAFVKSDLLSCFLPSRISFDVIVANLPYVSKAWETSPETAYEPRLALYAESNGLELIYQLIEQSMQVLAEHGLLLLEADPEQHADIVKEARRHGFQHLKTNGYAMSLERQASR